MVLIIKFTITKNNPMIGTALAVGSMIYGLYNQIQSGEAAKKAEKQLQQRKQELDLEYKYDYNMDFLNTPMAKSAISLLSQRYIENARKLAQSNVISGASNEKAVAGAAELQKPFVNSISSLAGYGQQRQDSLLRANRMAQSNLFGAEYNAQMQRSANLQNAASNAFTAAGSFSKADASGAFKGGDDWITKFLGN